MLIKRRMILATVKNRVDGRNPQHSTIINRAKRYLRVFSQQMFGEEALGVPCFDRHGTPTSILVYASGYDGPVHDSQTLSVQFDRFIESRFGENGCSSAKLKGCFSLYTIECPQGMLIPASPVELAHEVVNFLGVAHRPWLMFWHVLSGRNHMHILVNRLQDNCLLLTEGNGWPLNELRTRYGNSAVTCTHRHLQDKLREIIPGMEGNWNWTNFHRQLSLSGLAYEPDPAAEGGAVISYWGGRVTAMEVSTQLALDTAVSRLGPFTRPGLMAESAELRSAV